MSYATPIATSGKRRAGGAAAAGSSAANKRRPGRRTKAVESDLPDRRDISVPESLFVSQLLKFEQKVDETIWRRHVEVQEALANTPPTIVTLQMLIYNEYENQDEDNKNTIEPPSWSLKICGRVQDPDGAGEAAYFGKKYRFSDFFRKVIVQLDEQVFPGLDSTIEWNKAFSPSSAAGFEIKRLGKQPCPVTITMYRDYSPQMFKVAKELALLIGRDMGTRPMVVALVWRHIIRNSLVDKKDVELIHCDEGMEKVFHTPSIKAVELLAQIDRQLLPPDPLVFKYTVQVLGDPQDYCDSYHLTVPLPETYNPHQQRPGLPPSVLTRELNTLNEQVYDLVTRIDRSQRMRQLFMAFHDAPVQALEMVLNARTQSVTSRMVDGRDTEEAQHAEHYDSVWIPDAIDRYLSKADADSDGNVGDDM